MERHVVITAMCGPYPEDKPEGTELWGVNRTFKVEPRLDRLYTFDPENLFQGDYLGDLAQLDIPVYTRDKHWAIPKSEAYPVDRILDYFHAPEYFTCTIAYMIAHALYEHCTDRMIDKLTLNGMMHPRDSMEYMYTKPCIEYWLGMAHGRGMKIRLYGYNALCKPFPWESGRYGYRRNTNADLCISTISAAYKACYEYPRRFVTAQDELCPTEDHDSLLMTKKILEQRLEMVNQSLSAEQAPALRLAE